LVDDLLLEVGWLGVTKSNLVGGQSVIAVSDGINSAVHDVSIEWVKEDFLVSVAINADSDCSSGDVGWEANIVQNLLVHSGEAS